MANDDTKLNVQVTADTSIYKSGMKDSQEASKTAVNLIKSDWQNAGTQVASSVSKMGTEIKGTFATIGNSIAGIQGMFLRMSAILAGGAAFRDIIDKTVSWTGEVKTLRKTLGITAEEASTLAVALRRAGIDGGSYAQAARVIARQLRTNEEAFGNLGISVRNADGTFKNSQNIMQQVINKLAGMKEGTDRNMAANEIFRRAGVDINKLMLLNAENMEKARIKAQELHLIIGPEGEAMTKKYAEAGRDLGLIHTSLAVGIGSTLLPALVNLGSAMLALPGAIKSLVSDHKELINGIMGGIAAYATFTLGVKAWSMATQLATSITALKVSALKNLELAIFVLQGGFKALTAAEMLAVGGWIIAGIIAIAAAFRGFGQVVNDIVDIFIVLKNSVEKAFYYIKAAIQAAMGDIAGAKGSVAIAASIDFTAGTGQDWFGKIKNYFSGLSVPGPTAGGTDDGDTYSGGDSKGPSPYDIAKAKWQAETDVLGMTIAKKLELYKKDLQNVVKTKEEELDYTKGMARLEMEATKENLETRIAFLDLEATKQGKNSEEGMKKRIQIAREETAMVSKIFGENSKEFAAAKKREVALEHQAAEEKFKIQKELIDKRAELDTVEFDIEAENIKKERELRNITEVQEVAALNALENKKYTIKLKAAQDQLALLKNLGMAETDAYKQLLAQLSLLEKQHQLAVVQQNNKLEIAIKKPFTDVKGAIQDSMASTLATFAKGTTSIRNLFLNMGESIINNMADMWAKNTAAALMGTQAQAAAAGAAQQAVVASTTATTGGVMGMLTSIGTALASIPWYGWVGLAILAGVSAAGGNSGSGGSSGTENLGRNPDSYYQTPYYVGLPSFDTGAWNLPADMTARVHKEELIVPAQGGLADKVRSLLSGEVSVGGSGAGAAVFAPNLSLSVNAIDRRGMREALRSARGDILDILEEAHRNFTRKRG